ncbi:MAG: MutT/Nudix family protein, partial [Parcubacteria group bacterium GW2011_GWB1_36_5]
LAREVLEETGVKIKKNVALLLNNTFIRSTKQHVVAFVFLCYWMSGEAKPLDDTISVHWIKKQEINNFKFAPNVKKYIKNGFDFRIK